MSNNNYLFGEFMYFDTFLNSFIAFSRKIDVDKLIWKNFQLKNFKQSILRHKYFKQNFGPIFKAFWTKPQAINNPKLLYSKTIFHNFRQKIFKKKPTNKQTNKFSLSMVSDGQIFRFLDFFVVQKTIGFSVFYWK